MASLDARLEARLFLPHQLPQVKRDQQKRLEESFRENRNPTPSDIILLAAEVGITETDTKIWFEHRLALWRKQQGLPANAGMVTD